MPSNDHFSVSSDGISWGHLGKLARYAELLRRADAAFKEGKHAT